MYHISVVDGPTLTKIGAFWPLKPDDLASGPYLNVFTQLAPVPAN